MLLHIAYDPLYTCFNNMHQEPGNIGIFDMKIIFNYELCVAQYANDFSQTIMDILFTKPLPSKYIQTQDQATIIIHPHTHPIHKGIRN